MTVTVGVRIKIDRPSRLFSQLSNLSNIDCDHNVASIPVRFNVQSVTATSWADVHPARPWAVFMRWHDLLFAHWPLASGLLAPLIPPPLELDLFEGRAWIGIVPFRMSAIRHRRMPSIPGARAFPELNVRTYVTRPGGKPGVWFFSLDAASRIAVRAARRAFHLPYFDARMSCTSGADGTIEYHSTRTHHAAPPAELSGRYQPIGEAFAAVPQSIEQFLTERYCLYAADRNGHIFRGDIHHRPWPLQPAEAQFDDVRMTGQIKINLPSAPPLLHFARELDVRAWRLMPLPGI